jgi:hypothetical protein
MIRSAIAAFRPSSRISAAPILSPVSRSARVHRRIPTARIRVRFVTEGFESVGDLTNLSRAGIFVASEDLPRTGAAVTLQFEPPSGQTVSLRGEVRWLSSGGESGEPRGFGVALREPAREYREFYQWAAELLDKAEDPPPGE